MEEGHSSSAVSFGSGPPSISQDGLSGHEDQEGNSLLSESSEEHHHTGHSLAESLHHKDGAGSVERSLGEHAADHPSCSPGTVAPGKGDGISTASLAGSMMALESVTGRSSADKVRTR